MHTKIYNFLTIIHSWLAMYNKLIFWFQTELQDAKKSLDEQKSVLRERNKELQKFEQKRKSLEREKSGCLIKIKEIEHSISKLHKDSRDATQRVRSESVTLDLHENKADL